jgi:hypothetical protein
MDLNTGKPQSELKGTAVWFLNLPGKPGRKSKVLHSLSRYLRWMPGVIIYDYCVGIFFFLSLPELPLSH